MVINKNNNFGVLRLFFAYLVILSHSPEMLDGNRSREILTLIFGTLSFGELAVDGFFLISGYLIYQSYENTNKLKDFLIKRVLRIFPGFIVASIISYFIFAPLSGGVAVLKGLVLSDWIKIITNILTLQPPIIGGVFVTNFQHELNGAMWTISYEFICYLVVPLIAYCFFRKYLLQDYQSH